ncbi:NUDIX domain-containing protein [Streptomyces sp. NPDC091972]|uniref:NUDIX domain-containing protein n=1 Tax=Streptomyces sp. NPDC091972 TaxID=3366007 RepID=UPI0037F4E0B3
MDWAEAVEKGWLHRVATTVCRDSLGRVLVHRRPEGLSRFPGQYNWLVGGAVEVGEAYEAAAARELAEELGVFGRPRPVLKFCAAASSAPSWLGAARSGGHHVVRGGRVAGGGGARGVRVRRGGGPSAVQGGTGRYRAVRRAGAAR